MTTNLKLLQVCLLSALVLILPNAVRAQSDTQTDWKATVTSNADHLIKQYQRQYVKFQDGSVQYIGNYIYEHLGLLPKTTDMTNYYVLDTQVELSDLTEDGCIAVPVRTVMDYQRSSGSIGQEIVGKHEAHDYKKAFFLLGAKGGSPDEYYSAPGLVKKMGVYTYKTTSGFTKSIPKYDWGEKVTKKEYLNYCKTSGLTPRAIKDIEPTATNPAKQTKALINTSATKK